MWNSFGAQMLIGINDRLKMSDHLSFIPPHSSVTLLQPGRCSQTIKLISCLMCQQSPGLLFVWMNHCFVKKILGSCQLFWQAGLSTYAQWRGRLDAPPHSNIQLCELQAFIKGKLATDSASLMFSGSCPNDFKHFRFLFVWKFSFIFNQYSAS